MLSYVSCALAAAVRGVCTAGSVIAALYRQQQRISTRLVSFGVEITPQTYGEFLLRTLGPLRHEPSAQARLHGAPVR